MNFKIEMNMPDTHKKLILGVLISGIFAISTTHSTQAHASDCRNGAVIKATQSESIAKTAERRQKVVEAVKEEVLSVQEACNNVIKVLPHDVVANIGRFIGISPPVTKWVQDYSLKQATNACRKQLNVIKKTVEDAKNDAIKDIAQATGTKTSSVRNLVKDGLEDGTFSDDNVVRAISGNENIQRDQQRDTKELLEAINEGRKTPPAPATAQSFATQGASSLPRQPAAAYAPDPTPVQPIPQVRPSAQQPAQQPRQGSPLNAPQQSQDASVIDRLRGLF